jgi:xanthosine utilization system XapX-like protein
MTHASSRSRLALAGLSFVFALALLAATAAPALAEASDIGRNVGREVTTWAKALLFGVVALVALPTIAKRDVAGGMVLAFLAIIVGGFAFAPDAVKGVIDAIWRSIGG